MLRKVTLGLIAAASLGAAALTPSAASAHGFHGGWHHGWGHGGFGFGGIYVNTGVSDCYQQQYIQTRHGVRLRTVNVCGYNVY
jgi:Spy/CpxP family protein refolding chaperone